MRCRASLGRAATANVLDVDIGIDRSKSLRITKEQRMGWQMLFFDCDMIPWDVLAQALICFEVRHWSLLFPKETDGRCIRKAFGQQRKVFGALQLRD